MQVASIIPAKIHQFITVETKIITINNVQNRELKYNERSETRWTKEWNEGAGCFRSAIISFKVNLFQHKQDMCGALNIQVLL